MLKTLLLLSLIVTSLLNAQDSYRFVILGDRNGGNKPGIFPSIVAEAIKVSPAPLFAINTGDLIAGYNTDTAVLRAQWDSVLPELKPLQAKMAFHPVPGNHDITYDAAEPMFIRTMGPTCTTFTVGPDRFVIFDNTRYDAFNRMPASVRAFLNRVLPLCRTARHAFVFFHKPFWYANPGEPAVDSLHALFKANNIQYVFNGHDHVYIRGLRDNIIYTKIGSSGGSTADRGLNGSAYHFAVVDVTRDSVSVQPRLLSGRPVTAFWVTPETLKVHQNVMSAVAFRNQRLPYGISPVPAGSFELEMHNPLDQPLDVLFAFDTVELPRFTISPLNGKEPGIPAGQTRVVKCSYPSTSSIRPAKAIIRMLIGQDTLVSTQRPCLLRELKVFKVRSFEVDGNFKEPFYAKARTNPSHFYGHQTPSFDSTWIAFSYDSERLYASFFCYDPSTDSLVTQTPADKRDVVTGSDDIIRFWLAFDTDSTRLWQIYLSGNGAINDASATIGYRGLEDTPAWDGVEKRAVQKVKDGWQGEFSIPWTALGKSKPTSFCFNSKRECKRLPLRKPQRCYQLPIDFDVKIMSKALLE